MSGKKGQGSKYTPAIAGKVIAGLKEGTPLTVICRQDGMPCDETIRNWAKADEQFALDIAHARDVGFDAIAVEALEIADDDSRDWDTVRDADGNVTGIKVDGEHVSRAKLRIETRLKLLAKWDPKRYGDQLAIAHSGGVTVVAQGHDADL